MTISDAEQLTRALKVAAQAFLLAFEPSGPVELSVSTTQTPEPYGATIEFDPLSEVPPFPCDPVGSVQEQKMSWVVYLGAIARINGAARRGATPGEVAQYAKKAGYADGRAVSGWNSRPGSDRVIENFGGARILNASGHELLHASAGELNVSIRGDITPLSLPPS